MDAIRMRGIDQRLGLLGSGQWAIGSGRMGDGRMGEWACGVWRCGDSWRQAVIYPTRARSSTYRTAHCPRSTAHCPLPTAHAHCPSPHRPLAHFASTFRKHNSRIFDSSHLFRFQRTGKALARVMLERNASFSKALFRFAKTPKSDRSQSRKSLPNLSFICNDEAPTPL